MKNTIKAKVGYRVVKGRHKVTGEELKAVYDGEEILFAGYPVSYEDYQKESIDNECFNLCEVFTTIKGNQFIYWRDEEIDKDYITRVY